jgi:hypothetical protein
MLFHVIFCIKFYAAEFLGLNYMELSFKKSYVIEF